jgi:hypothetical protein
LRLSQLTEQDATNVARVLTALGDQDVLIESNARINQKKRWPWMGKPGEVKWEEWMSILQPLNRVIVEEKLEEKVPIIAPIEDKTAQESMSISPGVSDRDSPSEAAKTDSSTETSESSEAVRPGSEKEEPNAASKVAVERTSG